jgi:hypothetical protein
MNNFGDGISDGVLTVDGDEDIACYDLSGKASKLLAERRKTGESRRQRCLSE